MKKVLSLIVFLFIALALCGQVYRVGDLYTAPDGSKGIVFFVLPDGSGGWVVALTDASTACQWGEVMDIPDLPNNNYGYSTYQQAYLDTAGYQNTAIIRAFQNSTQYAAGKVDFANGWYLPAPAQLGILYAQQSFINNALVNAGGTIMSANWYWTSSEASDNSACRVDFGDNLSTNSDGQYENHAKTNNHRVRAVRSFSYTMDNDLNYSWSTGDSTQIITVSPDQTTTYTVTVTASGGCTDMAEHMIIVNSVANEEVTLSVCDSYEWNGRTYTESGDYTVFFHQSNGCDSAVTLHLTVAHLQDATVSSTSDTICLGGEVTLQVEADGSSSLQVPNVAIGDILCTDNSIVKPSDWPVVGKTAMGIVFYVDNTGEHGWAMHLQEQGTDVMWTPNGQYSDIPTLTNYTVARDAITDLDGYSNTQKIRNAGNATTYPAAYAVDFDNGWYLPAVGQLRLLLCEIVTLNASLQVVGGTQFPMNSVYYNLSSTEFGQNFAWGSGYSGNVISNSKNSGGSVRSVRAF